MLLVVGVALVMIRDLFAVAMLTGIYSLLAFTEAAVGAGITTVLFLATMSQVGRSERKPTRKPWAAMAVCSIVAALLIYASFDMPKYGDPHTLKIPLLKWARPTWSLPYSPAIVATTHSVRQVLFSPQV